MATIGSLTEFAEGDGDWIEYVERLEHFFLANDISDEAKKRLVLLSACGARTYKLIRNLTMLRKPGDFSFKELVMLVQNHHCPKPSLNVQRFKFHTHSRKPGVSVAAYVTELRQLSEHCEFGGVLDDMLCDRLVCGINDDGMQRRLLGEPTLDFKKALEIAQAIETAANNTKDIRKANNNIHSAEVHHVSQSVRGKLRELLECYRCGGAHFGKDCVFKDSTCHNCKKKGHLVLLLDEESKKYVTINTHKGLFKYNRLVFGVGSSPAIFQRTMDNLLQNIPGVAVYLDDILVTGKTEEEHLRNLEQVLKKLSEAGLRLKRSKCVFQAPSVTYLGHRISAQGLSPLEEKVRVVKEAPSPKNVAELRSFLGLVNYYGRFLPDLSSMLAPLYGLLHKDSQWRWSQAQEKAFRQVKELLQSAPLLVHFDPEKEVVLSCDASPYGIGAVLSHRMEEGEEKPVGYASRTLTAAEKGYSQLEKEGLAIAFSVKQFHQYLYGRPFTVVTDHKPLLSLFSETKCIPPMASARVQRWALTLSAYQYRIVYKAGPENVNADAFSCLPLPEVPDQSNMPPETVFLLDRLANSPVCAKNIKAWTERDPELSQVKQWLLQGWPATCQLELSVQDGCILWGSRVIVPPPGRSQIIEVLHPGISRMKSLARSFVWWPGMDSALEDKVKACSQCQSNQKMPPPAPLHPWECPGRPWSRLHLDFAGPFLDHMFLVLVDAHSKWLDAHITPTITAPVVTDTLRRIFATHGLPEAVVTDNGPTFTSGVFQEFIAVETLKDGLKKMPGLSIEKRLCRFLFQYRVMPHTTIGLSPAELLMGRKPRSHLDLLRPDVGARVTQSQGEQKVRHDLHARGCVFKQGDCVYIKNFTGGSQWLPGVIHHSSGPVSFVVELLDGRRVRRHKDHVRARTDGAGKRAQSGSHAHGGDRAVDIVGPQSGSPEGEVVSAFPEIGIGSSVSLEGLVEQSKSPELNPATGAQQAPSLENPAAGLRRSKRQHKPPDRLNC
ncbi:Rab-interacting lysosomal protein [Sarotherodon galilaeus]